MKFGLAFANVGPFGLPDHAANLARTAEACGFESLWTVEHVVVPAGYQSPYPYASSGKMPGPEESAIPDPLVWLSYVAAVTQRIRLEQEGVRFRRGRVLLAAHRWRWRGAGRCDWR